MVQQWEALQTGAQASSQGLTLPQTGWNLQHSPNCPLSPSIPVPRLSKFWEYGVSHCTQPPLDISLQAPETTEGGNDHKDRNTRDLQWALSSGVRADGRDGADDQGDDDDGQATMMAIVVMSIVIMMKS